MLARNYKLAFIAFFYSFHFQKGFFLKIKEEIFLRLAAAKLLIKKSNQL
jgi:hypothetical protein